MKTFYQYEHGGNRGESEYDSPADAYQAGLEYAEWHKSTMGFALPVDVIEVTEREVLWWDLTQTVEPVE